MIETILWAAAVLIFVVLALYGVAAIWVSRAGDGMKRTFTELRSLRSASGRARSELSGYSESDPEPFGSRARELAKQVHETDAQDKELLARYGKLQEAHRSLSEMKWPAVLRLPVDAYHLYRDHASLNNDMKASQGMLEPIDQGLAELKRLGWTVAEQARATLVEIRDAMSGLAGLQAEGVQDPDLEAALERGQRWESAIASQAPVVILSGREEEVLRETDKGMIGRVHEMVNRTRPDIEDLQIKVKDWQEKHASLKKTLAELPEAYRVVADKISTAEAATEHPIQWDLSREPLANARQQIERLGDSKKARTLEQLENELAAAGDLEIRLKEMDQRVGSALEKHQKILALLAQPDVTSGIDWLRSLVKPVEQVEEYSFENWNRDLEVETLREDLEDTANLHRALMFDSPGEPVKESVLDKTLEQTQQLSELHEFMRPRVASIATRLGKIQAAERETVDTLSRARAALNQAVSVVASSAVLGPEPVNEVEQLRSAVDPLIADFEDRKTGSVDKKVERADALLRKADQQVNRWRERMETELNLKKRSLTEKIIRLKEIALLDEPVIVEAGRFIKETPAATADAREKASVFDGARKVFGRLGREETRRDGGEGEPVTRKTESRTSTLGSLVNDIKRLNEEYQNCAIVYKKVEEVEEPVLHGYEQVAGARESALQLAARGSELIPDGKNWPPSSLNLINERRQLSILEQRWASMQETPTRAMQLVSILGSMSGEYTAVAANMRAILERVQVEQSKILELEDRLAASLKNWERLAKSPSVDRVGQDDIAVLVDGIRQEQQDLRERYLQGGISYNQTLQSLRSLCQRLDSTQIEMQDGSFLDLGGWTEPQ